MTGSNRSRSCRMPTIVAPNEPRSRDRCIAGAEGRSPLHPGGARGPRQGRAPGATTLGPRELGAGAASSRSDRAPRGAGADAPPGARPDPLRTHARLAVRVLPRRRVPHGRRSLGRAADGSSRTALRRRAPLELRHLRGAGPAARLQHQRLRRNAAGAVRVGREAARGEHRRGRPRPRVRRVDAARPRHRVRAPVPRGDGGLRAHAQPRGLVHAPGRRAHRGATERERLPAST